MPDATECPVCGETFSTLEALEEHELHHHEVEGDEARPLAERRQRAPGPGAAPGGNPEIDPNTGRILPT